MYEYSATLVRIVDGDTVVLEVDLGFRTYSQQSFRLVGYDAPERGEPGAHEYRNLLLSMTDSRPLTIRTHKGQSFNRWLCEVFVDGESVNDRMREFIKAQDGAGKMRTPSPPIPPRVPGGEMRA